MKQSILCADRSAYEKNLRANILLCILLLCAMVILHGICTYLRTEQNHTAMLLANIATDVIGGSFLIAKLSISVFPRKKLLKLYDQGSNEEQGEILETGDAIIHYIGVDCYEIILQERRLFLPAHTITLIAGEHYRFRLKGNLIVEVWDDESA